MTRVFLYFLMMMFQKSRKIESNVNRRRLHCKICQGWPHQVKDVVRESDPGILDTILVVRKKSHALYTACVRFFERHDVYL